MPRIAFPVAVVVPVLLLLVVLLELWRFGADLSEIGRVNRQSTNQELAFAQALEAGKLDLSSPQGTATVKAILTTAAADRKVVESTLHLYTSLSWVVILSMLAHVSFCLAAFRNKQRTAGENSVA